MRKLPCDTAVAVGNRGNGPIPTIKEPIFRPFLIVVAVTCGSDCAKHNGRFEPANEIQRICA